MDSRISTESIAIGVVCVEGVLGLGRVGIVGCAGDGELAPSRAKPLAIFSFA